jgi:hypothetical protein
MGLVGGASRRAHRADCAFAPSDLGLLVSAGADQ